MMRDAKIFQIFEGTNQILRNIIGQALKKEFIKNGKVYPMLSFTQALVLSTQTGTE